jgi:DNA-binding transcriptional ArsR family regulator
LTHNPVELIPQEKLEKKAETLKAMAHPVRLQIINTLMNGELSVGNLVKRLGTKQSLTSQQLSNLKLHGILKARRNGNVVYYSIENKGIKNIIISLMNED